MNRVFLLGACRTPIGKMGGALSSVSAVELGAHVIRAAVERAGISAENVDHVYMGCVIQAGLGQNVARQAAIKAGLPFSTTAETINVVCGSGLDCVNNAARLIKCGDADIVVAGGMESMSQAPFAAMNGRYGYRMGSPMIRSELVDTMVNDALWDAVNNYHMGITAENVAEKYGITRTEQDEFALSSQNKACNAIKNGLMKEEIVPIPVRAKKETLIIDSDEGPREGLSVEKLAKLRAAFKEGGSVTAGNSSGINDGAAAVVLVSEDAARKMGLKPMAEWIDGALAGIDPAFMGEGPVASTKKLMERQNITMDDVDLIEANEAFAAQSIAVKRGLDIPDEKLNINGGAIALGHPVGASGCRILVTLIHNMIRNNAKTGIATLCIGGGMGCSVLIKRSNEV